MSSNSYYSLTELVTSSEYLHFREHTSKNISTLKPSTFEPDQQSQQSQHSLNQSPPSKLNTPQVHTISSYICNWHVQLKVTSQGTIVGSNFTKVRRTL